MEDLFISNNTSSISSSAPYNQSSIRTPPYSPQATAAFAAAITFMMILTIVGNILVIIAVLTSRSLRGPQNLFLVSLAAADILVATLIIPFSLANELQGYWAFRSVWCEIYLALDVLFCTSSIVHLCAISLDRYLSISRPVSYGARRTPRRIKAAIVVVWLIAAVISFPPLLSLDKSERGAEACELNSERWYILYSTIGSFFAPCVIMVLVYVRIYQIAKQHTRCPPGEVRMQVAGSGHAPTTIPAANHSQHHKEQGEETAPQLTDILETDILETNLPGLDPFPSDIRVPPNLEAQTPPSSSILRITSSSRDHMNLDQKDSKEQPDVEKGAQANGPNNDSSSSGSEAELEKACQGVGTSRELAEANKTDNHTLEPSGAKGFKVHVLSLAQRYKNTMATSTGTKMVSEAVPDLQTAATSRRKAALKREKRFTFVLAVVIGVFVVCWFPFFFSYILKAVCPITCSIPKPLFTFFFWIGYCNSCLNPVIYTIFNKDFRKAFKKILCRGTKGTFF